MNRRSFLFGSGIFSAESNLLEQDETRPTLHLQQKPSLLPFAGDWNRSTIAHLLRRTVVGPTYSEMREAETMGMEALVTRLITPSDTLPLPPRYVGAWMEEPARYCNPERKDSRRVFCDELRRWWCSLMITDHLSIRERMHLFWHNHFACDGNTDFDQRFTYVQNQGYRRHALGDFRELLRMVTLDKGMLIFLNGRLNRKGEINENYARELQELFTLGVATNDGRPTHSQRDVAEIARVLSGWGWEPPDMPAEVRCPSEWHDTGDKVIYGRAFAGSADAAEELDRLLDLILERDETARHIVRKLYRFFVYTDAPLTPFFPIDEEIESQIIVPLAKELRRSNWNIASVLRPLFMSEHFYDPGIIGGEIKSPIDLFVGTARALSTTGTRTVDEHLLQSLHMFAWDTGQWLLTPPGVQGWAFHHSWISSTTLPQRRGYIDRLIEGFDTFYLDVPGDVDNDTVLIDGHARLDILSFCQQFPSYESDPRQLVIDTANHLLAFAPSPRLLEYLFNSLLQGQPDYEWPELDEKTREPRLKGMIQLLMRSANYQLL